MRGRGGRGRRRGNSAGQAALFLAGRTRRVYLLIRGDDLGKSMSKYLVDRVTAAENVELLSSTEVREFMGEDRLEGAVVEDNRSGIRRNLGVRALFAFIGADANTSWLEGAVDLDERGFVLTGRELDGSGLDEDAWRERSREPFLQETSLPGVFAAGDARSGSIKRCTSAVGEGAMAVRSSISSWPMQACGEPEDSIPHRRKNGTRSAPSPVLHGRLSTSKQGGG